MFELAGLGSELKSMQLSVHTAVFEQFFVCTDLGYRAVVHHDDHISALYRR